MLDERFWSKVDKNAPNGCWEWTAHRNPKGYGRFQTCTPEGPRFAHRLAYEDKYGRIPKGQFVCHACDNPACVNPAHLWLGSNQANMVDCHQKNRHPGNGLRGERIGTSILSDDTVIAIRRDYVAGLPLTDICQKHGISKNSLSDYTGGRTWPHLFSREDCPSLNELKAESARRTKSGSKITREIAERIRVRLSNGELGKDLASEYGIHNATVSDIRRRKIWR